jgi:hypothetical protein
MVIKAGAEETKGGFTLIEQVAPAGFAPPLHVHRDEDEAFYVLEGEITVTCGSKRWSAKRAASACSREGSCMDSPSMAKVVRAFCNSHCRPGSSVLP